ncbi:hypothetical protein BDN70DRAFT_871544 [Pholiota conissans]|uniref:Glucose-methanol-choline oxidoreductase N-terminal domain-containing protein n=1 Tax=Pholiota conissans TaxID=109636 RepID=A0A9P5ZCY9_9AGAR|nr:hypothetical protein BDN70DRAFT_871544 [Pholiota conissans]
MSSAPGVLCFCYALQSHAIFFVLAVTSYVDKNYKRVSAETACLTSTPDVLKRKNLTVAIHATTTRVLFDTMRGDIPRVEFWSKEGGHIWEICAKNEVIVSGGAVHSPHILILSFIGPAELLKSHEITPIINTREAARTSSTIW